MKPDPHGLDRREFLAGSGLFILLPLEQYSLAQEPARLPARPGYPGDPNAYLRIGPDGRVTCLVGKVELGQGSMTALAQLLAEELDVPLEAVDMIMGDTDRCPWDMGTFGSLSIRQFGPVLRAAGAQARAALLAMASERLGAPPERLEVRDGVIAERADPARRVSFAELVQGKRIERRLENVPLKPPSALKLIGRSPRRKDALEKVTGRARYAGDILLPGMLHARILRPPAHGAILRELDASAAEKTPGARLVRDGDLVAVLHERRDLAEQALERIRARFERPPAEPDENTIFDHLLKTAPPARVVHEAGDLREGERLSAAIHEARYLNGYVAHAALETHSATAQIEGGKVTVWAGAQTPFPLKQQIAQALNVPADSVRIITTYVGGGFGGKSASRQAIEAARLARLTGRPVQVVWDRAEEFFYDTFRPAAVVRVRAGLEGSGRIVLWDFQVCGAGDREARQFYDIPHQRTTSAGGWSGGNPAGMHPFAVGPWRAPSVNTNTFARESHMDALAARAGADPLEFRLRHLSDARMRRVLEAAAERFGWKPARAPSGRGVGVSCALYLGTYVAMAAEVSVERTTGRVQVRRVVCAQDQGLVVSPDGSRQQMEGSIMMGLGYALAEEVRFRGGEVLERNFDTYRIPRFSWLPRIETVLIDNPEAPASGCGEPPIVNMGAVLANAIFDAVGARLLRLPMTAERILAALRGGR